MSAPHITLTDLPSLCQQKFKNLLVEISQSSDKSNFFTAFSRHLVESSI